MNDETKAAVERVRSVLTQESFDGGDFEGTDLAALLSHLDALRAENTSRQARVAELEAALVSVEQTAARVADRSLEVFELRHEFRLVRQVARAALFDSTPKPG